MTTSLTFTKFRRGTQGLVLTIAGALLVVACSGDDTAEPTIPPPVTSDTLFAATTTERATTVPDIAEPATTTTAPDPTPPTTAVPPTEPTTSPPTTVDPEVDPEVQAVIDGLVASWNAFNEIKLDPFNDDKLSPVAETHRDRALDSVVALVEGLRIDNRRSITNTSVPSDLEPFVETIEISGSAAVVEYCWINSNILVVTAGNDDGTDRVVDDSVTVSYDRETFELIGDRWIKTRGETIETANGALCDVFR